MRYANELEVLRRLLAATRSGKIQWTPEDGQGWRSTHIGDAEYNRISYRFRYIEAWPQIGADPLLVELAMPGLNAGFAIGTEGFDLLYRIHYEVTRRPEDSGNDGSYALAFLERNGL